MARFQRDEKRTYPFIWLLTGGLFALSSVWAFYAELVTRVPWQEHQEKFYDLELELANQALKRAEDDWADAQAAEPLKGQMARRVELEQEQASGDYAAAKKRLDELDKQFNDAEQLKTFGASDLDEAYYYRNLTEYERDSTQVEVRRQFKQAYPDDPKRSRDEPNAIYADPTAPALDGDETKAVHHLRSESARMAAHVEKLNEAIKNDHPATLVAALRASLAEEAKVIDVLAQEMKHQAKIDAAISTMNTADGPAEPRVKAKDPAELAKLQAAARQQACAGNEDTRSCIKWLKLGPVDGEMKQLTLVIAKTERSLKDAQLRADKAKAKAVFSFDPSAPLDALIGPYQIQQVVTHWMEHERDVDIEQVDRCHTCHMGVNSNLYTDASIPLTFRSHPRRDILMKSHPIDSFGCTACHQGQGRATDDLAHSGWHIETKFGKERWHYTGDHYWEDPLLQIGHLSKIVIDDLNDELEVRFDKSKKVTVKLPAGTYVFAGAHGDHGGGDAHAETAGETGHGEAEGEAAADPGKIDRPAEEHVYGMLQEKLQEALAKDDKLAGFYRAVVRKVDNRVQIGLELKDDKAQPKKAPRLRIKFSKARLGTLLGFLGAGFRGVRELDSRTETLFTAAAPPSQPVRADDAKAAGVWNIDGSDYQYQPPDGDYGLQIPAEMANRFIQGLPGIESGCLRCHNQDPDLVPRTSQSAYVSAKLKFQKAEAQRTKDPVAYLKAHGTDALPTVPTAPADAVSLAPTLDEGRRLFRQLNCTGCHLLEGYENNRDQGPGLDLVAAKVKPEWLLTWLRKPRGWRAKTSMPNLWPRPLDPASKLPYPPGSPEHGKWKAQRAEETIAVAAFLLERGENPSTLPGANANAKPLSQTIAGYASVDGANKELGKQVFESYGCQGCHATVEGGTKLPEAWRKRERDIAPTLSNLSAKTNADWIAYWVEDPSRYWHGSAMPKLRLSRVEAASVAQYLMSLSAKPHAPAEVTPAEVKRVTDAKARNAVAPCTVAAGQPMSLVDCGARVVEQRGCYGCHQISGFDLAAPIGPELTGFGKKDVSTLDYGYAISDHHMQTTETFATLKLDSPRIYSRDRIELKMGDFDMSAEEIRAVVVFLKGTVPSKPTEKFDPTKRPGYADALKGRELVRDLNCAGCHKIEGRGADIDGWRLAALIKDPQRRAPWLDGEGARVQPEWLFNFLREPKANGIRPWLHPDWAYGDNVPADKMALRMPSFNLTAEQWTSIVRYFATWDRQAYPFQVPKVTERDSQEKLWAVKNMNSTQTGNCLSCHYYEDFPKERARGDLAKMAPNLNNARNRLRPAWVKQWLLRPHSYLSYTKMTAFFASVDRPKDAALWPKENDPFLSPPAVGWDNTLPSFRKVLPEEQAELLRDFLYQIPDGSPWPAVGQEAGSMIIDPQSFKLRAQAGGDDEADAEEPAPAPAPGGGAQPGAPGR
jgi:mono/diheme cytochrome c family protein